MIKVTFLGTSAAIPTLNRDNTSLLVHTDENAVLIDCGGSPLQKLLKAGVDWMTLSSVIITHRHIDHLYGFPSLIFGLYLLGRTRELVVYAPPEALNILKKLLILFSFTDKVNIFPIRFVDIELKERIILLENDEFLILSSPVEHGPQTIALKLASKVSGRKLVYSSDTRPCQSLFNLAQGVDTLIMESTLLESELDEQQDVLPDHTSAFQAGQVAQKSGIAKLILIHLNISSTENLEVLRAEVQKNFNKEIIIPSDFDVFCLDEGYS